MSHLYNDEQRQIREEVGRVLATRVSTCRLRDLLEHKGVYDADAWSTAREMGWTALGIDEAEGGLGLGLIEGLIVAEECGRALLSAPFLATGAAITHALASAGDPIGVLSSIASGDIRPVLAFAEGAEPLPPAPTARFENGRLWGKKSAVLGAAAADLALVLASDASGAPLLALVDLRLSGVSQDTLDTIDNSRCLADLYFEGATATPLPAANPGLLARECLGRLALFLAAECVGGADHCIALSTAYANDRQAFGQAIGKFQAVKHAIAEMYVLNEMARASLLDAAVRLERGDRDAEAYLAAARLNAVQAYETAAAGATQIHGGLGVTWEADLHLHYRRARAIATEAGAPTFWEDLIVAELAA